MTNKTNMIDETLTPTAVMPETTEVAAVLSEYEHLVSPEGRSAFASRVEQERSLLGIERATLDEEQRSLDRHREVLLSGKVADSESDAAWNALSTGYGELIKHEAAFRNHQVFSEERDIRWNNGSGMLFSRYDPAVSELLAGLSQGAETEEQPFMRDRDFMRMVDNSQPAIVIEARDEPLELPLTAVVSAATFESWETGYGKGHLKDGHSSADVIRDYASRDTPPPPVDEATALIFEDGRVVIMTSNAHRVAAAKMRGQSTMQFKELIVRIAKEEQPLEAAREGLGILAVRNVVSSPPEQIEQPHATKGASALPSHTTRWQRFVAGVNYHRKHRRH